MMNHDLKTLPKWAQKKIEELKEELVELKRDYKYMEKAHNVLSGKSWYPLWGPVTAFDEVDNYILFILQENGAKEMVTIYEGDVLLVGRGEKR
jgi:predicted RNase H-like nuclease (RuvC/YqgF family)